MSEERNMPENNGERRNGEGKPKGNYYYKRNGHNHYRGNRPYYDKNNGERPVQNGENTQNEENISPDNVNVAENAQKNNQDRNNQDKNNRGFNPKNKWNNKDRNRFEKRQKTEETVADIQKDCERIEKEIQLEINEIETIKLSF